TIRQLPTKRFEQDLEVKNQNNKVVRRTDDPVGDLAPVADDQDRRKVQIFFDRLGRPMPSGARYRYLVTDLLKTEAKGLGFATGIMPLVDDAVRKGVMPREVLSVSWFVRRARKLGLIPRAKGGKGPKNSRTLGAQTGPDPTFSDSGISKGPQCEPSHES